MRGRSGDAKYAPHFVLRPLEERRVLSISPAVALALAAVNGETDIAQGIVTNPDPATPLGTDAAHQTPIDPGEPNASPDTSEIAEPSAGEKPAAEDLTASDNSSAAPASVAANVEAAAEADGLELAVTVESEPPLLEGSEVAISAEFTDALVAETTPTEGLAQSYSFTIDWGDGHQTTGVPTLDGQQGSFAATHFYADNGVYSVTVTLFADERSVSETFDVTIENVLPSLVLPGDQVLDEGDPLEFTATFSDPGFDNPDNPSGEVAETFFFTIDWGDGNQEAGIPLSVSGGPGVATTGSFVGQHMYATSGVYTVTVFLIDDDAISPTVETFTVTVNAAQPTLMLPQDQTLDEGDLLEFTAQFTDPHEGGAESYSFTIDWGDGHQDGGAAMLGEGQQGSFAGMHYYADNGVYTVTVTLFADDRSVTETFEVTVHNVAPVLADIEDQTIDEGDVLSIDGLGQFTDPAFDNPDNPSGEVDETFFVAIEWGDGSFDAAIPMIDVPGGPGVATAGSFGGQHLYATSGVYTVRVTISDDDGGTTFTEFTVTVNTATPTLTLPEDQVLNEGDLLEFTAQFTDPHEGGAEAYTFTIDWGDGKQDGGAAMLGEGQQGSFAGMHYYADNGVYTVTVTLFADERSVTETFEVTVHNVAPVLADIEDRTIDEGDVLSIPDLGQFTDPGFDNPDNPAGEVEETFFYVVEWGDGSFDAGIPTIDVPGGPGVLTAGTFDGTHLYATSGVYTVRVTVSDDDGGTTFTEFTVTVNAATPTLTLPEDQILNEGDLLEFTAQFTDPHEGGAESYSFTIDWGDGHQDGGAAMLGEGQQGSFAGMHYYADNGIYTVTVTLFADERSTTETFQVTVLNVAPVLANIEDQMLDEGDVLSIVDLGQFTDPGFDNPDNPAGEVEETFFYVIEWGDGSFDAGIPTIDVSGGPGVLTAGTFDGTHLYATSGVYTVRVTVSDDDGGTDFTEFTVIVKPAAPIVTGPPNQVTNEGSNLSLPTIGQFIDPHAGGAASYTYTIDWGDGKHDEGVPNTIVSGGEGELVHGSFSGAHIYADNGIYTVVVTVFADMRLGSATFQVLVNNVAPNLSVVGNQTVALGTPLSLTNLGQFTDPGYDNPGNPAGEVAETFVSVVQWGDGNSDLSVPTIDTAGGPGVATGGSFDGQHFFGAPGVFTVTATVFDDDGGAASQSFTVTVFVIRDLTEIERALPGILFVPGGAGGGTSPPPPEAPVAELRQGLQPNVNRIELRRGGTGSVAGAEPRLVLRVVTPAGIEDTSRDELLPDEVLDNLRLLFRRLSDGHYRIYLIQPDGVEILVVDVIVRQGRNIDVTDEPDGAGDAPGATGEADEGKVDNDGAVETPAPADNRQTHLPVEEANEGAPADVSAAALALGGGYAAYARPLRRRRLARAEQRFDRPRFDKVRRLLRRLR